MREIKFFGEMPDPFKKEDGTRMTPDEWRENRAEILEKIVDIEFGGMPPRPEIVEVERLNGFTRGNLATPVWYRVTAGTKEKQLTFNLEMYIPSVPGMSPSTYEPLDEKEKYPVVLTGDGCYMNMDTDSIRAIRSKGYIAARFNRLEIATDVKEFTYNGGIRKIYDGSYSDISAWAWGYMVCMDVFEKLSFTDETEVAITGHSRGGKTVLLAAAVDERIKYVCPNNSGCHGAVSHRCYVENQGDASRRTETIGDMLDKMPSWMGEKLIPYRDRVQDLPYDMHYFGAMIAPRYYLQCEGMQDYWINPIGAWQNFAAVKECYRYLGCEDHAGAWFRPGEHRHKEPDYSEFMDFIIRSKKGMPLREHLQINPYPDIKKNFSW